MKTDISFVFDKPYQEAFEELKLQLISILVLYYYSPEYKSIIEIDISDRVIASIFLQLYSNKEQYLVAYFLKTIVPTKYNYEIYNKEILTIVRSLAEQYLEL